MLNNSDSKPKFDYDMPLEALLDDGGDDIDNEAEILMWIKDFLTNELGKLGVNVPMLLMNNIRSLGSDELVLQVRWLYNFQHLILSSALTIQVLDSVYTRFLNFDVMN